MENRFEHFNANPYSRNILKGEKVTDSYGMSFLDTDKITRQKFYKAKYNFLCECDACTQDYPTFKDLERELSEEDYKVVDCGTNEINAKLASKDYIAAITLTKQLFNAMVSTNISELHAAHQRLKITLGTCCRLQFSVNV